MTFPTLPVSFVSHFQTLISIYVLYQIREILILISPPILYLPWHPLIPARTRHWFAWVASPVKQCLHLNAEKRRLTYVIILQLWYHGAQNKHNFYTLDTNQVVSDIQTTCVTLFPLETLSSHREWRIVVIFLLTKFRRLVEQRNRVSTSLGERDRNVKTSYDPPLPWYIHFCIHNGVILWSFVIFVGSRASHGERIFGQIDNATRTPIHNNRHAEWIEFIDRPICLVSRGRNHSAWNINSAFNWSFPAEVYMTTHLSHFGCTKVSCCFAGWCSR